MDLTPEEEKVRHIRNNEESPVRLSYAHIFEPKAQDKGVLEYSTQILIPKEDKVTAQRVAAAMQMAIKLKFNGNLPPGAKNPWRDGDKEGPGGRPAKFKAGEAPYAGHFFMNLRNRDKPQVVDQDMQFITDSSKIVSGDYANVSMTAYGFSNEKGTGVSFALGNVQLVRKGEPLGNTKLTADQVFTPIAVPENETAIEGETAPVNDDPSSIFG